MSLNRKHSVENDISCHFISSALVQEIQHHYPCIWLLFFSLSHTRGNLGFVVPGSLLDKDQRTRKQHEVIPPKPHLIRQLSHKAIRLNSRQKLKAFFPEKL